MHSVKRYQFFNIMLASLFLLMHLVIYLVLPVYLLSISPYWSLLLVPFVFTTTAYWALLHECFHGSFHANKSINRLFGRLMSIGFGCQYRILRFGHLMHHRFNRTELDRSEVPVPGKEKTFNARPGYYYWLLGGLYIYELFSNLGFLQPRGRLENYARRHLPDLSDGSPGRHDTSHKQLLSQQGLFELRLDGVVTLVLLLGSLYLYGEFWYLLTASVLLRGTLVSLVDNSFHYGAPLNDPRYAFNLALPCWLSGCILHFNLHRIHHLYPTMPWWQLPQRYAQLRDTTDLPMWLAVTRQLRGPVAMVDIPSR